MYEDNDPSKVGYLYNGDVYLSALTDIAVPSEDSVYGDSDGDGKLSLSDVTVILKYIAEWDGTELNRTLCDVDENGRIGLEDITLALKLIAGWNI